MELKLGMALNYSLEKGIEVLCRGRRWVVGTGLGTPFFGVAPGGLAAGERRVLAGLVQSHRFPSPPPPGAVGTANPPHLHKFAEEVCFKPAQEWDGCGARGSSSRENFYFRGGFGVFLSFI